MRVPRQMGVALAATCSSTCCPIIDRLQAALQEQPARTTAGFAAMPKC